MMQKAWSGIEEVPYCFPGSSVKFLGHTAKKNHRFWPELSVSGLQLKFEFTDGIEREAQSLMFYTRGALLFFKVIRQISRSHGSLKSSNLTQIGRF